MKMLLNDIYASVYFVLMMFVSLPVQVHGFLHLSVTVAWKNAENLWRYVQRHEQEWEERSEKQSNKCNEWSEKPETQVQFST